MDLMYELIVPDLKNTFTVKAMGANKWTRWEKELDSC